jgi:phage repressor protein C with HTH and peptisase S24 domain
MENINDRIKYLREVVLKLSVPEFAEKLGTKQPNVWGIENHKNKPSNDFLEKLYTTYPELNMNWLHKGTGGVMSENSKIVSNFHSEDLQKEIFRGITYLKSNGKRVLVELPYFALSATASFVGSFDDIKINMNTETMYLPYMDGFDYNDTIITDSNGESMEPTIKSGSRLLSKRIDPNDWVYTTGVCVVIFGNMTVVKRIRENTLLEEQKIKLYSDNESSGSITVKHQDIRAIFKVCQVFHEI